MLQFSLRKQVLGRNALRQLHSRKSPFSTSTARLLAEPPLGSPKPPKRHRIRNFFLGSTLILTGSFAGAIYYSLKDDDFYYKFTSYVPFVSIIVDTVDDIVFRQTVGRGIPESEKNATVGPVETIPVDATGKASAVRTSPSPEKASDPNAKEAAAAKAERTQRTAPKELAKKPAPEPKKEKPEEHVPSKPVNPAVVKLVGKEDVLPPAKVVEQKVTATDIDPVLSSVKDAVNVCLRAHNVDLKSDVFYADLVAAVKTASDAIKNERAQLAEKYQLQLKKSVSGALESADKDYLAAKLNLVESYNNRLQLALDAVTKKALAAANNKVSAQYVELWKQFGSKVVEQVEQERDGRLSQITELKKDITTLQEAMLSSGRILESEDGVVAFFVELANLQRVLSKQDVVPLKPYIDSLTRSLPSDPLVKAVADSISPSVKKYGVLSHTQLAARFSLIEPKIRQASLAPPDAGIAGHLGSLAASQLLARKEGLPEGTDVESVLARTQTHLQQGDVLRAVAEVNSLQGWPKKIAADWLDEGRKRSEVEFLVNVLSDEGRLWSISRN